MFVWKSPGCENPRCRIINAGFGAPKMGPGKIYELYDERRLMFKRAQANRYNVKKDLGRLGNA